MQTSRAERGFALLIVLWALVFLALLTSQILAASRSAVALAGNLRAAAELRAAEDGAIYTALWHVLAAGPAHWAPGGPAQPISLGGSSLTVRVRSLDGLVNPNTASAALLTGLLRSTGAPVGPSAALAQAIIAWRSPPPTRAEGARQAAAYRAAGLTYAPPGTPFQSLDQLGAVLGMSQALYAALLPYLSLDQPGDPDPALAPPAVARAIALARAQDPEGGAFEGAPTVQITACPQAALAPCRLADVSVPGAAAQTPYQMLSLRDAQ